MASARAPGATIWIINHYAISPDLPGGTRHFELAKELVRRGHNVRVFACDINLSLRQHTKLSDGALRCDQSYDGVDFTWVNAAAYTKNNWRRTWNMLSFAMNVVRIGLSVGESPDCIVGSSPHPFAALAAWVLARAKRARFVLELRDLWPQALVDMGIPESSPSVRAMRVLEKFLYQAAQSIVILAAGSRQYLAVRGIDSRKVAFIPNGVHLGDFDSRTDVSREELRAKYGFTGFTVVYTGAHGAANSLGTVLDAAPKLKQVGDLQIVLIGDGPEKEWLVSRAQEQELSNVRFLDPVPKGEIPDVLRAADGALITLRDVKAFSYGISPNKLFDYMAARKPIICAVSGDIGALVRESGCGFSVAPEQPGLLADALIALANLPEEDIRRMGACGRRVVEESYDRRQLACLLEQVCLGQVPQNE